MKKFLIAIMLFAMGGCCNSSEQTLSAVEAPIRVVGRTAELADGSIQFDWSGVYIDIRFKGTYLAIELSDTKCNYYNLVVDGVAQEKFKSEGEHTTVVLFDDAAAKGEHHIRIQKATEAEQGRTTIHSLSVVGKFLPTDGLALPRHIEFYGDSLTCGYGTESLSGSDPFLAETENCCYTYAALTAEHFGADYNLISHSGRGLVRNYGDEKPVSEFKTFTLRIKDVTENTRIVFRSAEEKEFARWFIDDIIVTE